LIEVKKTENQANIGIALKPATTAGDSPLHLSRSITPPVMQHQS